MSRIVCVLAVLVLAGCAPSQAELLRDKATARCVAVPDGMGAEELDALMSLIRTQRDDGFSKPIAVQVMLEICVETIGFVEMPTLEGLSDCGVCVIAIVDAVYAE